MHQGEVDGGSHNTGDTWGHTVTGGATAWIAVNCSAVAVTTGEQLPETWQSGAVVPACRRRIEAVELGCQLRFADWKVAAGRNVRSGDRYSPAPIARANRELLPEGA